MTGLRDCERVCLVCQVRAVPTARWRLIPVPHGYRGLCSEACQDRWLLAQQPVAPQRTPVPATGGVCQECGEGGGRTGIRRGLCPRHYMRWWREQHGGQRQPPRPERCQRCGERFGTARRYRCRGLCGPCYALRRRAQGRQGGRPVSTRGCQWAGCPNKHKAGGYCARHYDAVRNRDGNYRGARWAYSPANPAHVARLYRAGHRGHQPARDGAA